MADICVLFASENEEITRKIVTMLRSKWDVWWSDDITQGNWDAEVRQQINNSIAVVPIISQYIHSKTILRDEIEYAIKKGKNIFPFMIEETEMPFGFGTLHYTKAFGWDGEQSDPCFIQLIKKISTIIKAKSNKKVLRFSDKEIDLPNFIFSLSSYDTQVRPEDGIDLFKFLQPTSFLLSAYDAWKLYKKDDFVFINKVKELGESKSVFFLDSGNYEAYRKSDVYSEKNLSGWNYDQFREIASILSPDISFAFDKP